MAESQEMVDIQDPSNPNHKKSIPTASFNPALHEPWVNRPVLEPIAGPSPEDEPGPPFQDQNVGASPVPLEDQPNAAVIEAPGSRAAEVIRQARGRIAVDLPGPRQDRAESETRRAEALQRAAGVSPKQTEEDRMHRREEYGMDQTKHAEDVDREKQAAEDMAAQASRQAEQASRQAESDKHARTPSHSSPSRQQSENKE